MAVRYPIDRSGPRIVAVGVVHSTPCQEAPWRVVHPMEAVVDSVHRTKTALAHQMLSPASWKRRPALTARLPAVPRSHLSASAVSGVPVARSRLTPPALPAAAMRRDSELQLTVHLLPVVSCLLLCLWTKQPAASADPVSELPLCLRTLSDPTDPRDPTRILFLRWSRFRIQFKTFFTFRHDQCQTFIFFCWSISFEISNIVCSNLKQPPAQLSSKGPVPAQLRVLFVSSRFDKMFRHEVKYCFLIVSCSRRRFHYVHVQFQLFSINKVVKFRCLLVQAAIEVAIPHPSTHQAAVMVTFEFLFFTFINWFGMSNIYFVRFVFRTVNT